MAVYFLALILLTQHTGWTEMIVYPYLLNKGFVLYKDLISPYPPLFLWFIQMVEMIFGSNTVVLMALTYLGAVLDSIVIYFISIKLWKEKKAAFISVIIFSTWFFYFEGNGLWFELYLTPFLLGAFYFLFRYLFDNNTKLVSIFLSGIFLGLAFFIKQTVVWVIFGVIFLLLTRRNKFQSIIFLILPLVSLFLLTSFVSLIGGYLKDYWEWVYKYTFIYFPFSPGHSQYPQLFDYIKLIIPISIVIPALVNTKNSPSKLSLFLVFLIGSFMSIFPRWGLFHLIPFLAILSVISASYLTPILKNKLLFLGVVVIWLTVVIRQDIRFFNKSIRFFEPEVYSTASKIKGLGESLYLFNGPDQIYPITGGVPMVKPYVQNFAWYMEYDSIQNRLIKSLAVQKIRLVVYQNTEEPGNYSVGHYQPKILMNYINLNYHFKEMLDGLMVLERNQ